MGWLAKHIHVYCEEPEAGDPVANHSVNGERMTGSV